MLVLRLFFILVFSLAQSPLSAQTQPVPKSTGSGFFVNDQGWLLTNAHVIKGCEKIEVAKYGFTEIKLVNEDDDVAALRVKGKRVKPLKFSTVQSRLGEEVIALGFPLSSLLSASLKVTSGNLSSLDGPKNDKRFLQHSAPIQNGNSGGPLLDPAGNVIGMNSFILDSEVVKNQNVNFALGVPTISKFLNAYTIDYEVETSLVLGKSTADVVEQTQDSVVQIICYGSPGVERSSADDWYAVAYGDVDFWGGDKFPNGLDSADVGKCAELCATDPDCKVFTYNPEHQKCFVKKELQYVLFSKGTLSGVIYQSEVGGEGQKPAPPSLASDFICEEGTEYLGPVLPFFQPGSSVKNVDACLRFCQESGNCAYMTFDRSKRSPCKVRAMANFGTRAKGAAVSCAKYTRALTPIGEPVRLGPIR